MLNERTLTADELAAREKIIQGMKKNKSKLVKKYGADAEKFMYGRATNIAKQQAEALKQSNDMKDDKLRKMIQDALSNPKPLKEDDWKQPDDESNMAHSQLASIIELATELQSLISDGEQLDAWVQAKLTKAQDYLSSANGYLKGEDAELKTQSPMVAALTEKIMKRLKNKI
jgi:hypothetical protein